MTEREAVEIFKSEKECMDNQRLGWTDKGGCHGKDSNECENCKFMYGQGTFAEHYNALGVAIQSLEMQTKLKEWIEKYNKDGSMLANLLEEFLIEK